MRNTWDFWLLLAAVVAWAMFKAWGVWQREQERKAELAEDLAHFQAEEAERRAAASQESQDSAAQPDQQNRDSSDPNSRKGR